MIRAVVGILKKDDYLLIAERPAGKPYSGYWEFPGGKIEENETGKEALIRELEEELGVIVKDAHFQFEHQHTYPDKTVLLEIWTVDHFIGEPVSKENQLLEWVTWPQLIEKKLLDGNVAILNKIR